MRVIRHRERNKYHGKYRIYDGYKEFYEDHPNVAVKIWNEDWDYNIGDYVEAEDGYILQVIGKTIMKNGNFIITFPNGKRALTKRGNKYYSQTFYGNVMYDINRLCNIGYINIAKDDKYKFVMLLFSGMTALEIMKLLYPKDNLKNLNKKLGIYMEDKLVKKYVSQEMNSFKEKLKDAISEDQIIKELTGLLKHSRPGSMAHRENIKLILEILELMPKEIKLVNTTEYQEIKNLPLPPEV